MPQFEDLALASKRATPAYARARGLRKSRSDRDLVDTTNLVFVVDGDGSSRGAAERALQHAGHRVQTFASAEAALAALTKATPAAVCLDLALPGTSGVEAVALIRAQAPTTPIVVISMRREVRGVVEAVRAGACDYLTKPVQSETLVNCVTRAIAAAPPSSGGSAPRALDPEGIMTLEQLERRAIEAALRRTGGNVTHAMKQLGIGRTTLYRKLKRYGLR